MLMVQAAVMRQLLTQSLRLKAGGNSLAEDEAEGDADLAAVKVNMKLFNLCTNSDAQACKLHFKSCNALLMKHCS